VAERNPDRSSYFPAIEKRYGQPMSYWFDRMAEISDRKYPEQIAYLREEHGFSQAHANALVLYSRGSTSSRRFNTLDDYLKGQEAPKPATVRAILASLQKAFPKLELAIAWNQPMLKYDGTYVFGVSTQKAHILIAPFDSEVLQALAPRLTDYQVNKKTVRVPVDWKVDAKLLRDMVKPQIDRIRAKG
jgi:uncharacterized protein YdhG (YjbR/CyaY superfamily)